MISRLFRRKPRCKHHWHVKTERATHPAACQEPYTRTFRQCCNCGKERAIYPDYP